MNWDHKTNMGAKAYWIAGNGFNEDDVLDSDIANRDVPADHSWRRQLQDQLQGSYSFALFVPFPL